MESYSEKWHVDFLVLKLERYFLLANIAEDSDVYIFSYLSAAKTGFKVRKCETLFLVTHVTDLNQFCCTH